MFSNLLLTCIKILALVMKIKIAIKHRKIIMTRMFLERMNPCADTNAVTNSRTKYRKIGFETT